MSKNLYLILGNGFTIDFINFIRKNSNLGHDIDVSNFFKHGAEIPWPGTNEPGFLSSKNCPNLWNLGARPNMDSKEAMNLIEDIITCINVYASHPKKSLLKDIKQNDIYFYAYLELVEYIRNLFVFYDNKICDISNEIEDWSWLKYIKKAYSIYEKIYIVTYNYDVWIERIFKKSELEYSIYGFEEERKIVLFKPHGSISFQHQSKIDKEAYKTKSTKEINDDKLENFSLSYSYEHIPLINAIIPPASEASRLQQAKDSWSKNIHNKIIEIFSKTSDRDDCIMCGISYWHVDRNEIDNILVKMNPKINIKMINPCPPKSLTAVLTSLFENFVLYPHSNILERLINE